jgi:hypothetical protein
MPRAILAFFTARMSGNAQPNRRASFWTTVIRRLKMTEHRAALAPLRISSRSRALSASVHDNLVLRILFSTLSAVEETQWMRECSEALEKLRARLKHQIGVDFHHHRAALGIHRC